MSAIATAEPYKISAGALALLVHAIFFSLLYFSFSWQMKPPQGMVVEIWQDLPAESVAHVEVSKQPEKQEQAVMPKAEAVPEAAAKADIEVKSKKIKEDKEKQEVAAAKKIAEKKLEETKLVEKKLAEKKLAEKKAEQAERRLEVVERQIQSRARAQNKAQEEAAIATGQVVDEYIGKIASKIRRYIVLPPGVAQSIEAKFNVTLLPGGEVLNAILVKPSGNSAYDNAVERAILKAQPLPLPPAEQGLFNRFRELRLKFSPAESRQ